MMMMMMIIIIIINNDDNNNNKEKKENKYIYLKLESWNTGHLFKRSLRITICCHVCAWFNKLLNRWIQDSGVFRSVSCKFIGGCGHAEAMVA
jgi:hypothetical protein